MTSVSTTWTVADLMHGQATAAAALNKGPAIPPSPSPQPGSVDMQRMLASPFVSSSGNTTYGQLSPYPSALPSNASPYLATNASPSAQFYSALAGRNILDHGLLTAAMKESITFHTTTANSFEEALMREGHERMLQPAALSPLASLAALAQSGQSHASKPAARHPPPRPPSPPKEILTWPPPVDKERLRRDRLEAVLNSQSLSSERTRLEPSVLEGFGKVISPYVPSSDDAEPSKGKRRRRGSRVQDTLGAQDPFGKGRRSSTAPGSPKKQLSSAPESPGGSQSPVEPDGPRKLDWVDNSYPWKGLSDDYYDTAGKYKEEKVRRLQRYVDWLEESDEEEEETAKAAMRRNYPRNEQELEEQASHKASLKNFHKMASLAKPTNPYVVTYSMDHVGHESQLG